MAKTKQTEMPFSFYERDLAAKQQKDLENEKACEVADYGSWKPFRAGIVPHQILAPKWDQMQGKEEYDRKQRIKMKAEANYKMAKLPPRMQESQDAIKAKADDSLAQVDESMLVEVPFDFKPEAPRPVPDFRRLQKAFVTAMEKAKKGKQVTVPVPYNFHEAKPGAKLRVHMDSAN